MPQVNILINKNIHQIITDIANKTGTTRKNIMSIAFNDILKKNDISKDKIENMIKDYHLDFRTSMNVSESFYNKMTEWGSFGLSERRFLGYLICDYFTKNEPLFSGGNLENEELDSVVVFLSESKKQKLVSLSDSLTISLSGLFSYYILNKEIKNFFITHIDNPARVRINVKSHVKKELVLLAESRNLTIDYFLKQLTEQIIKDYKE